jgi:hypothetical protein
MISNGALPAGESEGRPQDLVTSTNVSRLGQHAHIARMARARILRLKGEVFEMAGAWEKIVFSEPVRFECLVDGVFGYLF